MICHRIPCHRDSLRVALLFGVFFCIASGTRAATDDDALVTFSMPGADGSVLVRCAEPVVASGWSLLIDNQDVTALANLSESRNEVRLARSFSSGEHRVIFAAVTDSGLQLRRTFDFTANPASFGGYALFDAEIGAALAHRDDALSDQNHSIDAALSNETRWEKANWSARFNAQANFADLGVDNSPLRDGRPVVPQFLLQTGVANPDRRSVLELGDMVVDSTPFIAQNLARRGAQFRVDTTPWKASVFSVTGDPALSFEAGTGLGADNTRNLHGMSGEYRWLNSAFWLRGAYLTGGRANTGLGVAGSLDASTGHATGVLFGMRPWAHGAHGTHGEHDATDATFELEYDRARYDANTADDQGAQSDSAYALRLRGHAQRWSYSASAERIGANYGAVGNEALRNDRATLNLSGHYNAERYNAALYVRTAHDNVDDDAARPQIGTRLLGADYIYSGVANTRVVLHFATTALDSSHEPATVLSQKLATHEISTQVLQRLGAWDLAASARFTLQDDRYDDLNDTRARTLGITPTYHRHGWYVAPTLTLTTLEPETGNDTRIAAAALVFNGATFGDRIVYAWYGAYNTVDADAAGKTHYVYNDARVAYRMNHTGLQHYTSLTGLRWQMVNGDDGALADSAQDWIVWLTYAVNAPVVY